MNLKLLKIFVVSVTFLFNYLFCGSKYAAYRLKPDDSRVIRLDDDYFVVSSTLYLMIRRYLVALRKGDDSTETLFHL